MIVRHHLIARLALAVIVTCAACTRAERALDRSTSKASEPPAGVSQIHDDLYDVDLVTTAQGWAVGVFGSIYHTANGGKTWVAQEQPTQQHLYGVSFTDLDRGWAVGQSGTIISTDDGGEHWKLESSGTSKHLFKVAFPTPTIGWAIGDWGAVVHTQDGGQTWADRSLEKDQILYAIDFADAEQGWIVGEFGAILHTTDGGEKWSPQASGTNKTLFGVTAISRTQAVAVGIDGLILRTKDAGATWDAIRGERQTEALAQVGFAELFRSPGLYDVEILGRRGFIIGDTGTVLATADGGVTWSDAVLPGEWRLQWVRGLSVLEGGRAMLVGANGLTFVAEGSKTYFPQGKS